jgi:hypothetical protein
MAAPYAVRMTGITSTTFGSKQRLTAESKACILRILGPAGQALIDDHEADVYDPTNTALAGSATPAAPAAPPWERPRGVRDAIARFHDMQDDPATAHVARMGLALLGEVTFPESVPVDSLLDRCRRHSLPDASLLPACEIALRSPSRQDPAELVALAQEMADSIQLGRERPMEKPFAMMRLMLAVLPTLGEVTVQGRLAEVDDFLSNSLWNMRDDAQSLTIVKVCISSVQEAMHELTRMAANRAQLVAMADAGKASPTKPPPEITRQADTITIGGVRLNVAAR